MQLLTEKALAAKRPVAFGFFSAERGIVSTTDGQLLLTTDGGRSWGPDGLPGLTDIDVVSARTAYAEHGAWLFRTDDGGASWQRVHWLRGTIAFADREHGWIDNGATLFATDDGGRTFARLRTPCPDPETGYRAESRLTAELGFLACGFEPGAGSQLKQLYVTRDAGRTWRLRAGEKQLPDIGYLESIAFRSARDGVLTAQRGGVAVTHDGGRTWHWILTSDFGASAQAAPDGWLVLSGGLFRMDESGTRRALLYPHSQPAPSEASFSTPSDGIGVGFDWTMTDTEIVTVTHDGGRTWHLLRSLPLGDSPDGLARAGPRAVYLVVSTDRRIGDELLRSTDDGRSWRRVATPRQAQFFEVSFPSLLDGVLGDDQGRFYSTRDGGRGWRQVHSRGLDLRTFSFLTPEHGFALAEVPDFVLRETRDGGRTWRPYSRVRLSRPVGLATLGSDHIWIEDAPRTIARSADGGRTWQRIELNALPNALALDFVTPSVGYAPAAPYAPYRTADGGRSWEAVG